VKKKMNDMCVGARTGRSSEGKKLECEINWLE